VYAFWKETQAQGQGESGKWEGGKVANWKVGQEMWPLFELHYKLVDQAAGVLAFHSMLP